jgi:DNA-binding transcriptional regulator YbjK
VKQTLFIAAGVLLAGVIGWAVADPDGLRHATVGYSDTEQKQAWKQVEQTQAQVLRHLEERTLEAEIRLAETRYGEGRLYRLCHESAPTAKQNKARCQQLNDKMTRADAEYAKHPW